MGDKFAGSKFEQQSEAMLAPKGWSTGKYGIGRGEERRK